ncbi:unnamed protein product [Pseudo-nitzschia multistriata]|uniref:RNA helicase n=1 Tax=Pseudo-nitzschia multistriata TaxID=183589 RepID=A0A448Z7S0_9STRA|nr:unnamed protein product [Pseudo-nitzschia multistriata]
MGGGSASRRLLARVGSRGTARCGLVPAASGIRCRPLSAGTFPFRQRRRPLAHGEALLLSRTIPTPGDRTIGARRCLSSPSSSPGPEPLSSGKEEHDRRVAAAQASVLARLERRRKRSAPPSEKEVSAAAAVERKKRRAVWRAVEHWLSRDPAFFLSTVEALDLNFRPNRSINGNRNNGNHHSRNRDRNGKDSSRKSVFAINGHSDGGSHPLQPVWDQYQNIYHESIPEYINIHLEEEKDHQCMDGNDRNTTLQRDEETKKTMLELLKTVGFGDPKWRQRFQQFPRLQAQQDQLARSIDEYTTELEELGRAMAKLRKSLDSLETNLATNRIPSSEVASPATMATLIETPIMDPNTGFLAVESSSSELKNISKAEKREKRRQRKDRLRRNNTMKKLRTKSEHWMRNNADSQLNETMTSGTAPTKERTLFQSAWESITSLIWGGSGIRVSDKLIETKERDTKNFVEDHPFGLPKHTQRNSLLASNDDHSSESAANAAAGELHSFDDKAAQKHRRLVRRIERRIDRKREAVEELQEQIDSVTTELREAEETMACSKSPLSLEEYERARSAVDEAKDSICRDFAKHIEKRHAQSIQHYQLLDAKTDLTKPHEWYSYARLDRRKIVFHGGPTNSGKTYSALERLKEAKKGLYLGPLRLLAAEIYETLTAEGLYTNLFTGQERREIAFSTHTAATVEMCNVNEEYDVVVIDEIQMISDPTRGSAWTKALLGLRCKEVHVCGGLEAAGIVQKLAEACGDDFELHRYQRFSDLKVSKKSLGKNPTKTGSYRNVQKGDCVVAFSRNDIFAIKREIESLTDHRCCVIYGKLPPQTRADQARRFNDPDSGYDVLVASDAIGMGLNLNIKRIVFNSIFKFNGEKIVRLGHSDVKQIAGRAGRRNSPYPNGEVTCRDVRDLGYLRKCLSTEIEPLRKAALLPTESHIELFAEAVSAASAGEDPGDQNATDPANHPDLHEILRQFSAMATVRGDYFLGRQTEMAMIAKRLRNIPIRLRDAYAMCLSPTTESSARLLEMFATKVSQNEVFGLPSRSVPRKARSFDDLSYLCNIYSDVDLFMWLQYKFPPGNAVELATAMARKERTMEFINDALSATERLRLDHCYLKTAQRHRSVWEQRSGGIGSTANTDESDSDGEDYDDDIVFAFDYSYDDNIRRRID